MKGNCQFRVTGRVLDNQSKEPIIGANLIGSSKKSFAQTNIYGFFNLKTNPNDSLIKCSIVGYNPQLFSIKKDSSLTILLESNTLESVTVIGNREIETDFGRMSIPIEKLKKIPAVGGEKDVMRALTILPGVAPSNESQASIFVRGGSGDQNLFVLDGGYLYNTGHLFNFLSIFNPDAISNIEFSKGNFQSAYGGRLSSVLDITLKEGNKQQFKSKIDIGLITSKFFIEGPIKKGKSSFIFSARGSYFDIINLGKEKRFFDKKVNSFFGFQMSDVSGKISHEFNQNNKLFFNFYQSNDNYRVGNGESDLLDFTKIKFNNRLISVRFFSAINKKLSLETSLSHTANKIDTKVTNINYERKVEKTPPSPTTPFKDTLYTVLGYLPKDTIKTSELSEVDDFAFKSVFNLNFNSNDKLTFGMEGQKRFYLPYLRSGIINDTKNKHSALEWGFFIENKYEFFNQFKLITGLRLSGFNHNKATFHVLEPRTSISFNINSQHSLYLGFHRMSQFNHAITRGVDFFDRLIWVPSTTNVKPQIANQISIGYQSSKFLNLPINLSIETYYRKLTQQNYFDGGNKGRLLYLGWENRMITNGLGRAYGLEFFITKNIGKLNGNIAYTLAWSERKFVELNNNKWFPFIYDRRNNLNVNLDYKINNKMRLSAMWVFLTGRRINLPSAKVADNPLTFGYELVENFYSSKLPPTHRLDLSLDYQLKRRSQLNFTIYNAYNRRNPFYAAVERYTVNRPDAPIEYTDKVIAKSIFPILPSLSWSKSF
jgi:outer membrane receptor for ferrienterochelin and colicin